MKSYDKLLSVSQFIITAIILYFQVFHIVSFLTSISIISFLPFMSALILRYIEIGKEVNGRERINKEIS